jgi:hypothetical protein
VENLRGRPRHSEVFASDPKAPVLTRVPVVRSKTSQITASARRIPSAFEGVDLTAEDERDERARVEAEERAEAEDNFIFESEGEGEPEPEPTSTATSAQPSKKPRGRPRGSKNKTAAKPTAARSGERPVGISKPTRAGRLPKPSERLLSSLE